MKNDAINRQGSVDEVATQNALDVGSPIGYQTAEANEAGDSDSITRLRGAGRTKQGCLKAMIRQSIAAVLPLTLCVSCATQSLWEGTNTREGNFIPATQITAAELDRKGVNYVKIEAEPVEGYLDEYRAARVEGYILEKSSGRKLRDHTVRFLGTPVAVVIDGASVVAVGSAVVVGAAAVAGDGQMLNMAFQ